MSSCEPAKPAAAPGPGSATSFSSVPSRPYTYARVVTSWRYVANNLPPAVPAPCSGSGRSGSTSVQPPSSGCAGSTSTTRQFGARRLVCTSSLSPTLSTTPNESSADGRDERREAPGTVREIADMERIAILAFAAIRDGEDGEPFIFGRLQRMKPLRVRHVLVHEPILRLWRADPMEEDLVVLVDRRLLLPRRRRRIPAVEEAIAVPRDARHLDPLERVVERRLAGQVHDLELLPVRAAARDAVDRVGRVLRWREDAQADRAIGRPRVRIDQHFRRAVDTRSG